MNAPGVVRVNASGRQRLAEACAVDVEPDARVVQLRQRVEVLAARCADAEAEFDAAVEAGFAMHVLVLRDQQLAAAVRSHRDALRDLQRATHAPSRGTLRAAPRH